MLLIINLFQKKFYIIYCNVLYIFNVQTAKRTYAFDCIFIYSVLYSAPVAFCLIYSYLNSIILNE